MATAGHTEHPQEVAAQEGAEHDLSTLIAETGGHIPMASRLSFVSWGDGSTPSLPAVDEHQSVIDDADSAIGTLRSSTMSVRSSVYDYIEENGRTYHRYNEGKYPLPNDLREQERLELQHALFLVTFHGKLFLAPISDRPKHVLDVGTGTGIWAIEFAQMFRGAEVIGTDLSPIQPEYIPSNVRFEIDDAEEEWTFSTKFDYIHGRALLTCFRDPSAVFQQAFHALAPGGYLELQEAVMPMVYANPPPENCALKRWNTLVTEGAKAAGRPWNNAPHYKRWLEEAGFENVVERRFYWPMNPWPRGDYYKTVGAYFLEDMLDGVEGISLKILRALGWSLEKIQELLVDVRRDMKDQSIHAYVDIYVVYGRKPMEPTPAA